MNNEDEIRKRVGDVPIPTNPPTVNDWVFLASFNEGLLDKEFNLANHRMSWMMTSQSILLGTFCLILLNKDKSFAASKLLLNIIPFIALAIIIAGLSGIGAAQIVIHRLERERSFYQGVLGKIFKLEIPDIGGCRKGGFMKWTRVCGFMPSLVLTALLLLLWLWLLLSRLDVAIKFGPFQ